jgi:anti-sigma factor RsiW
MNCQETMNLWSSYQDCELDEAMRGEIQRHLHTCPACREFYAAQGEFDAALTQTLRQGARTPSLWQKEEAAVRAALAPASPPARSFWAELLWPSPRYCVALAAVWIVLLAADRLASMDASPAPQHTAPTREQLAGVAEQRREMKALLMAVESELYRPAAPEHPRNLSQPPANGTPLGIVPERRGKQAQAA